MNISELTYEQRIEAMQHMPLIDSVDLIEQFDEEIIMTKFGMITVEELNGMTVINVSEQGATNDES